METPKYLLVLSAYKWLLAFGVLVAIAVGLVAGFTIKDGEIVSRVEQIYPASTTLLLSSPTTPLFQSEIPGEKVDIDATEVVTDPVTLNLDDAAVVYAYLVTSKDIQARVENAIGEFGEEESITAVSRTTQPAGDENFPGRLSLPILDVVAYSSDPARAETISRTAASVFEAYVVEQQDANKIDDDLRVLLQTLRENPAGEGEGSNQSIPIVIGAGATMVAFIALAFLLYNIRAAVGRRRRRRETIPESDYRAPAGDTTPEPTGAHAYASHSMDASSTGR